MRPKKSLGQNFLVDPNIIKKIVNSVNLSKKDVVEIGPGTGNLTKEIFQKNPKNLVLIEKDKNLYKKLNEVFLGTNVEIINEDILKTNLKNILKKNIIIFGNLPYNISTQILIKFIKLLVWPPNFKKLIFMFQKEVGEKIKALPNSKNYGRISIIRNFNLEITESFIVKKNCFYPKPKVDSMVLIFNPKKNRYKIKDISSLEKVTQILFSRKRKMINKAFRLLFKDYKSIAQKYKIDLKSRPNQLSFDDFYKITEIYEKRKSGFSF